MALCFNRKPGQSIIIGDVTIDVVETHRTWVRLRVHAPIATTILRAELVGRGAIATDSQPEPAPVVSRKPRRPV